jgi:hypothetical protein
MTGGVDHRFKSHFVKCRKHLFYGEPLTYFTWKWLLGQSIIHGTSFLSLVLEQWCESCQRWFTSFWVTNLPFKLYNTKIKKNNRFFLSQIWKWLNSAKFEIQKSLSDDPMHVLHSILYPLISYFHTCHHQNRKKTSSVITLHKAAQRKNHTMFPSID